jgi:hypothetical protein
MLLRQLRLRLLARHRRLWLLRLRQLLRIHLPMKIHWLLH